MLRAIKEFGPGSLDISVEDFTVPGRVVQLGVEPKRIDLLTAISGATFDEAWQTRSSGTLDGISVEFIGLGTLLRNKDATGRNKDRIDADELRNIDPFR